MSVLCPWCDRVNFTCEMFARLLGGYTLNLVYCTAENFKRYQTKLKGQEILKESFYDFAEADSMEIALPKKRQLPLLSLGSFKIPGELSRKFRPRPGANAESCRCIFHEKQLTVAIAGDRPRSEQISRITTELRGRMTARFVQVLLEQLEVAIKSNAVMEVASLTKRLAEAAEGYAKSESQEINRIDTAQVQERIVSEDATVIDLVNTMLTHADKTLSTDIHLIPFPQQRTGLFPDRHPFARFSRSDPQGDLPGYLQPDEVDVDD